MTISRVLRVCEVPTSAAMHELGKELGGMLRAGDLVILDGPLGAGKTTLTRGIGDALAVRGPVTSPTFVLARTHPSVVSGPPLVHVDAYRLTNAMELDDLDIDYPHAVVVVEWGAGMLDGVAESWMVVAIERRRGESSLDCDADEPRAVTITGFGPRWVESA